MSNTKTLKVINLKAYRWRQILTLFFLQPTSQTSAKIFLSNKEKFKKIIILKFSFI